MQKELDQLLRTYPELMGAALIAKLPLHTLSALGLKRSEEAVKHHLCYKASVRKGHTTTPGLWLKQQDFPVVRAQIDKIQLHRKHLTETYIEAARKQAEVTAKRKETALKTAIYRLACASKLKQAQVQALITYPLAGEPSLEANTVVIQIIEHFARLLSPSLEIAVTDQRAYWVTLTDGLDEKPCKLRVSLHCPELLAPLLLQDSGAFSAAQAEKVASIRAERADTYAQWRLTAPAWYAQSQLLHWAHKDSSARPAHPLFILPDVAGVTTGLLVKWRNKKVLVKASALEVAEILWQKKRLLNDNLGFEVRQYLGQKLQEQITLALPEFEQLHPFGPRAMTLELNQKSWTEQLQAALNAGMPAEFNHPELFSLAEHELKVSLLKLRETLAITRCKSDMPPAVIDLYPVARSLKRRITFIHGPTNSGKTYEALELLKAASCGVYLGPLRLLALEIFDTLNYAEVPTNLHTGEVIEKIPGAMHTSSTIEMLNFQAIVDVAVIDEVQMLGDVDRGSAWLQAVLGAPAHHVVLVGSDSALQAVRQLAKITGEPLTEIAKKRLNPLEISASPIKLSHAPAGSALIVFSRKEALSLATHLRQAGKTVSVIYGALSPEVRTEQARQFRSGESQYLVATDAIGMGLNLPVHTVIFTQTSKFDGERVAPLTAALTQQIGGRAGRYGLKNVGCVTALDPHSIKHIQRAFGAQLKQVTAPFNFSLMGEVAQSISRHIESTSVIDVMQFFDHQLPLEPWLDARVTPEQYMLGKYLDKHAFTLPLKLLLSNAPAVNKGHISAEYFQMVEAVLAGEPNKPHLVTKTPAGMSLQDMEEHVQKLTLYCWMQQRFPQIFQHREQAQESLKDFNKSILKALTHNAAQRCPSCSKTLPWNHAFKLCESCFRERRSSYDSVGDWLY